MFGPDDARRLTRETRVKIGFSKNRTSWENAQAVYDDGKLTIKGHPVMESWETPYMEELAAIATSNGGVVLEIGFGLGISAGFVQDHDIDTHIVVEANEEVFGRLEDFAQQAGRPVIPVLGFWQDVIPSIPDESVDGILFDTYPLTEEEVHCNHFSFFRHAHRILRSGGIMTYYSDEISEYSPAHRERLRTAGFTDISRRVCDVDPPPDCAYWQSKTILTPLIRK